MKRGIVICLLLILSFSFISAGFFSDFWKQVNGKVIGDGKECVKEGKSIPVMPECCEGLKLIKPKSEDIVGISGICTAKCGDGVCDTETESEYNCPEDCRFLTKYKLTCKSTYTTGWHYGKCRECKEGYILVKCKEWSWWLFKRSKEVCEKIYETECLANPKCEEGETIENCPEDCKEEVKCTPECEAIGTKSEGWYDSCTGKLIKWDNCDGCFAVCKAVGTRSEGWYSSCDGELITWDNCREVQQSCLQLGGSICSADTICLGEWIDASDSERCCDEEVS